MNTEARDKQKLDVRSRAAALEAGGEVKRYHTLPTIVQQTVAHHSYGVAWWCAVLTDMQPGQNLLLHALLHDVAEAKVGDMPSPVKRHLGADFQDMENTYMASNRLDLPPLNEYEALILKLADCLDGVSYCRREVELGNRRLERTLTRYQNYIFELDPKLDIVPDLRQLVQAAITYAVTGLQGDMHGSK